MRDPYILDPGGENHDRCNRPRPAVCLSARTTVPCGIELLASSRANVLVEKSSSKTKSDCSSVFVGSKAAKVSGDSTANTRKMVMKKALSAGLPLSLLPFRA